MWSNRRALLGLIVIVALLIAGCGDDDGAADQPVVANGFVGTMDGTDAFVAVVLADDRVAAYVCDGDEEIAEYFWGPVGDSDVLDMTAASGAALQASVADDAVSGEITLSDGSLHRFRAEPAQGDAGLYYLVAGDRLDAELSAGWIVGNDGEQRGAVTRRRRFERTPRLANDGVRIGESSFAVARIGVSGGIIVPNNVFAPKDVALIEPVRVPNPPAPFVPIPLPNIGSK